MDRTPSGLRRDARPKKRHILSPSLPGDCRAACALSRDVRAHGQAPIERRIQLFGSPQRGFPLRRTRIGQPGCGGEPPSALSTARRRLCAKMDRSREDPEMAATNAPLSRLADGHVRRADRIDAEGLRTTLGVISWTPTSQATVRLTSIPPAIRESVVTDHVLNRGGSPILTLKKPGARSTRRPQHVFWVSRVEAMKGHGPCRVRGPMETGLSLRLRQPRLLGSLKPLRPAIDGPDRPPAPASIPRCGRRSSVCCASSPKTDVAAAGSLPKHSARPRPDDA